MRKGGIFMTQPKQNHTHEFLGRTKITTAWTQRDMLCIHIYQNRL